MPEESSQTAQQTDTHRKPVPTFVFIGADGDGKSSIINKEDSDPNNPFQTLGEAQLVLQKKSNRIPSHAPLVMTAWPHIDAMGIGNVECGVTDLIAGLGEVLDNSQVSGIIVSNLLDTGRIGIACQII